MPGRHTVGVVSELERICPQCRRKTADRRCSVDGYGTVPANLYDESDHQLIGTIFEERYRLTGLLGKGGMGAVYQAEQLNVGSRAVAIKLLRRRQASSLSSNGMPDKLADCRIHGMDAELLIVEGNSAAGPAKQGRNSEMMAVLPLRGKVVNAGKASLKQVVENAEAQALITAISAMEKKLSRPY